jgi:hypothetical protein
VIAHAHQHTHPPARRRRQVAGAASLEVRPPPQHGLPPLSRAEIAGLRRRLVLRPEERSLWGAVYRKHRPISGAAAAIERADREVRFARGDVSALSVEERQLDLLARCA